MPLSHLYACHSMGIADLLLYLLRGKYARAAEDNDRRFDPHFREHKIDFVKLKRQAKGTELVSLEERRVFHGEQVAAEFSVVRLLLHACDDLTI